MSGLFSRLARQAIGQPRVRVRQAVEQPFQDPPEPLRDLHPEPEPALAGGRSTKKPEAALSLESGHPIDDDDKRLELAARSLAPEITVPDVDRSRRNKTFEPGPDDVSEEKTRLLATASSKSQAPYGDSAASGQAGPDNGDGLQQASRAIPEPGPLASPATRQPPFPIEATEPGVGSSPALAPWPSPQSQSGAPTPLLPARQEAGTITPAELGIAQPAAPASQEVHVHIGRIDIRAAQSSPAKPEKSRGARAPMSLDEYLAGRKRS